jgi:hypothetical protein
MNNFFQKKYGGSAGRILDSWGMDRINKEIGDIYEEDVFGKPSVNMNELLNEYYGDTTGGKIKYSDDLREASKKGIIKG